MNSSPDSLGIDSTTWFCVAFLLAVTVYFKFTRLWALRNLDLLALLSLAPGWLFLERASQLENPLYARVGAVWLVVGSGWCLLRMLLDPLLRRRPTLEPNLSAPGMTFLGVALLAFTVVQIITKPAAKQGIEGVRQADALLRPGGAQAEQPSVTDKSEEPTEQTVALGPGWQVLQLLGFIPAQALHPDGATPAGGSAPGEQVEVFQMAARTMAILGHAAIVIGLVVVASFHFRQLVTGVGIAVLYLLLPYTDYHAGRTDQILLGALLSWAVVSYRYPIVSGVLLAWASGAFYFPIFLLPLWTAFYWKRGAHRFLSAFGVMVATLVLFGMVTGTLAATGAQIRALADPKNWIAEEWGVWRIPVFVTYVVLCTGLAFGPQPKNLGTLIAHSAVVILGTQFWYLPEGGAYVLWYLPLVLLTVFRPNLRDRVVPPRWGPSAAGDHPHQRGHVVSNTFALP